MQCHSATAATPFYGNLPLIGPTVKADMREGTRYLDLTAMLEALDNGKLVSEADLAKVEDAALSGSMPPAKYSHMPMHWGTNLDSDERRSCFPGRRMSVRRTIRHLPSPKNLPMSLCNR